jgi:hypothetical protein
VTGPPVRHQTTCLQPDRLSASGPPVRDRTTCLRPDRLSMTRPPVRDRTRRPYDCVVRPSLGRHQRIACPRPDRLSRTGPDVHITALRARALGPIRSSVRLPTIRAPVISHQGRNRVPSRSSATLRPRRMRLYPSHIGCLHRQSG